LNLRPRYYGAMTMSRKPSITLLAGIALTLGGGAAAKDYAAPAPGEYLIVISGEDWGPAVTKLVVCAGKRIEPGKVGKDLFTVAVHAQGIDANTRKAVVIDRQRSVLDAYASDAAGVRTDQPSLYMAVELPIHPADALSNPLFWDPADEFNKWKKPYDFTVESQLLAVSATRYAGRVCEEADAFAQDEFTAGGVALSYAWYRPKETGLRPLIVWLHGAGEGGTDPYIALLGNKVTALASEGIQGIFGGAYVLVPQSPIVWMTQGGRPYDISKRAKSSMFSEAVEALIRSFVASHPGVDARRIYLGGCSNGGYMTVNLVLRNPGYFAAAFPVCEAYPDEWLSKKDIELLAKERMWFTASAKDAVVDPKRYLLPTVRRIKDAGGEDIHLSYFDSIVDTTGKYKDERGAPYEYDGHWSWLRVLDDECSEGGTSLMRWLASRSR
jgi:poly(3-hydroxybutyrate) depolymerase